MAIQHLKTLILAIALALPSFVNALDVERLIVSKASEHGVDPVLLRSLAIKESSLKPWSVNIDGEGYHFKSKEKLMKFVAGVQRNQWLLKIKTFDNKTFRRYYRTESLAKTFMANHQRFRRDNNKPAYEFQRESKQLKKGRYLVRNVRIENTDLGLMQINYRVHGERGDKISKWLDPKFNVDFAARLLKSHMHRDDDILVAAAYYHSATPKFHSIYLRQLRPIYEKELKGG